MARLEEKLQAVGCPMDAQVFLAFVIKRFDSSFRALTDEGLLCRPRVAVRYCDMVRDDVSFHDLPDSLILRTLTNARKRSQGPELRSRHKPLSLASELRAFGLNMDAQMFRDAVAEIYTAVPRSFSPEDVLHHPDEAMRFGEDVRRKVGCAGLPDIVPDMLILRTFLNIRKRGGLKVG
jgi:hypothetical protein